MNRLSVRTVLALLAAVALAATLVPGPAPAQEPVRIGFFSPVSGLGAADGTSARRAAELAVEDINGKGGINGRPVELQAYDDQSDAKQAVSIAQKLVQADRVVAAVSGSYSFTTRPAASVFQSASVPLLSAYAVHPGIPATGDLVFQMIYSGEVKGKALGNYAVRHMGLKNLGLVVWDNDYGKSIARGLEAEVARLGSKIALQRTFASGEKDFAPLVTAMKAAGPDGLVVLATYAAGAEIVRQARRLGISAPLLGPDGLDTPEFVKLAGAAGNGVVVGTNFSRDDQRPIVQQFISRFRQRYQTEPDMVGASTYDSLLLLAAALRQAGTDPQKIKAALADTREFEGVTGKISFDSARSVQRPVVFARIDNGQYRTIAILSLADLQ